MSHKDEPSESEMIKSEELATTQVHRNNSLDDVIGDLNEGRKTRNKQIDFKAMIKLACFISIFEPKTISEALEDGFWTNSMHEELEQFARLNV